MASSGDRPEAQPRKATSLGSGFVIDPAGYIVTNNHVIADADEITVILHDDTNLKAELVGRDTKTDVAVLKVKTDKPLAAARWGDSDKARVGDWVLAIGNPFGLGGSVTAGILSARQRDINSGPYDDFLQTDAAINRGNSGGPMFNMDGEVIGINTAIYSPSGGSIGIGFAIPSNLAKAVVAELIQEPDHAVHRGWLGVRIQAVTDEIAESLGLDKPHGALVASVNDNGPAQTGGIQPGDVILSFDGKPVPDMRHLPRLVAEDDGRQDRAGDGLAQASGNDAAGQARQARRNRAGGREGAGQRQAVEGGHEHGDDARPHPVEHHAGAEGKVLAERREGGRRRRCHEGQPGGRKGPQSRRRDHGSGAGGDQKHQPGYRQDRRREEGRPQIDPAAWSSGRAICASSRCASTRVEVDGRPTHPPTISSGR